MTSCTKSQELAGIIRETIRDSVGPNEENALMFSGGLDSAILAIVARKFCDLRLYTAGLEGSNDLEWGLECARTLDLPCVPIVLKKEDIIESMERVAAIHKMTNPNWVTTFVGFDLVLGRVGENNVLCGQGADELFGGYRKYLNSAEPLALMKKDLEELAEKEFPIYSKVASHYGRELRAPYLDRRIIEFASRLPAEELLVPETNKLILRNAAEELGLPGMMSRRPKKAMQYGTGISKVVKNHLKSLE